MAESDEDREHLESRSSSSNYETEAQRPALTRLWENELGRNKRDEIVSRTKERDFFIDTQTDIARFGMKGM